MTSGGAPGELALTGGELQIGLEGLPDPVSSSGLPAARVEVEEAFPCHRSIG